MRKGGIVAWNQNPWRGICGMEFGHLITRKECGVI